MRKILFLTLITLSIGLFGQKGITFEVEKLSKPEKLLFQKSYIDIYQDLILRDANLSTGDIKQSRIDFQYEIISKSDAPDSLVDMGSNSFFFGMYQAYADHRPFVLSPDMIWLLISQGFARHVNANHEELRKYFVNFSGKQTLVVESEEKLHNYTNNDWESIFPQFTKKIAEHTGEELINTLSSNFSTTTSIEKVASEITIMEAMEPYFEFVTINIVCGIPKITLLGTPEDWQKILEKTRYLGKYNLKWWTNELDPILQEFVKASKGDIDKKFWRNMFKYHSQKKYGAPKIIDGWIVKFFPYDKDGKRNNLTHLEGGRNLPEEIVKVDLKYIEVNGIQTSETMLELWAGFIGLEQDSKTFALTPKISWMIRKKDMDKQGIHQKLETDNVPSSNWASFDVKINEVPEIFKKFTEIYSLGLNFKDIVFIPDWFKNIRIGKLEITGKITQTETDKIVQWFPKTDLTINGKQYNFGKNGWIVVYDKIPESVLNLDKIWVLEIWHSDYKNELVIPDRIKDIIIENLSLVNKTSDENIEKIKRLLPTTKLFVQGQRIK